ncbi:hypothetical protein WA026_007662 [Henosepilachna vigintioctopunctata]|uniref:Angiogenic factor with G patch and FHA domains 1 n=1 Tax=Henosepilachna vigintioctopunctata TaxID=420089 RepID=A0AAW1U418_9CUCU
MQYEGNIFSDSDGQSGKDDKDMNLGHNKTVILSEDMRTKLVDLPEIIQFIEKLLKYIAKQKHKVKKLESKLKKSSLLKNVTTQTESQMDEPSLDINNTEIPTEQSTKSLAEDIKDAAEKALQNSGFVYEETSGMYYDYNTGYYYNAEYGLYYDGNTGTYLKYNQDKQSYEYHSQVTPVSNNIDISQKIVTQRKRKVKEKLKVKARKRKQLKAKDEDIEEGQCSDSSSEDTSISGDNAESDSSDITKQWPPCMRIIVEETSVPKLKAGSLHIVTFEGGSIGREGNHAVLIPDINISKHHLNISYNKDTNLFQAIDMGSRNGTLLNGTRMAPSKQESDTFDVVHGSRIQMGSTVLLCHVHEGHQTCGHCEPGLVELPEKKNISEPMKSTKSESHKKELQNLKKKFGVVNFEEDSTKLATGYTDRAQKRRQTVGSQNPHEKTQTASVEESISSQNKGFKLLSKMGWKEGQALGKERQGILEPINLESNEGTTGIGCKNIVEKVGLQNKKNIWKKTQERFEKLTDAHNAFEDSD